MTEALEVERDAEEREHSKAEITVIVNGQEKPVSSRDVTFDQVVDLAFPGHSGDPNLTFTVTYRHAESPKHDGSLVEGRTVHIKTEGTIFGVTRTTKS